ncbi:uncharacterized protein TRUGW13939_09536 [Talaromyces rugulosus]|uniref:Stress-response A/B barrel domain-containing protein n=1 Tax=Talaromyces rugulosus TaxID=121627 RepID=A0A7H8R894_TALRU|nr:uncharacterized protein TRUGW13939_09536 [Talaromyces rugulosus]QKX62377.1 hypothetical protein TRUGW13939_09536 [Talaromyces rugulosus]
MAIYHVVLFKLKDGVSNDQLKELVATAKGLIGRVPGLTSLEANKPLPSSAAAAQGYNAGIVAVLEDEAALAAYNEKSNGATAQKWREELVDSTLVYDLSY